MRAAVRRRLVLLAVAVSLVGGGWALYAQRERSRDAAARRARAEGMVAFGAGDYSSAVHKLGLFIRRLDPDAEALLRYAQAIRRLPDPDADYLESAVVQLRRCIGLNPNGAEARREILDLYRAVGARSEALDQADWFLARDPSDPAAIRAKASILASMRRFADAYAVLESKIQPDSPSLIEQLLFIDVMAELKRPASAIRARAEAVAAAQPDNPRMRLVVARALLLTNDELAARATLELLLSTSGGDPEFVRMALPNLDAARLSKAALRILSALPDSELDPRLRAELIRRLAESGEFDAVVSRVDGWGMDPELLSNSVLGRFGLALARRDRSDAARQVLDVLRSRVADPVARGWVRLLSGGLAASGSPASVRIDACIGSIQADPSNAHAHYELGLAYREVGEVELGLRELTVAARLAPSWAVPLAAAVRVLAESGRLPAALAAAMRAEARGSDDPGVLLLTTSMRVAAESDRNSPLHERVAQAWERVGLSAAETLPIRVAVAAMSRRTDEARTLIESSVVNPTCSPSGDVLLACALLSRASGLHLEGQCFKRYEALFGNTPALALAIARATDPADAAAVLAAFRARRTSASEVDRDLAAWSAAEAELLDGFGRADEARSMWRSALAAKPGDAGLLRAILDAPSTAGDAALARLAIDALRRVTGDAGLAWQFHDARWNLLGVVADQTVPDGVIRRLRGILEVAPEHRRARLLLAGAFEANREYTKAIEHLLVVRNDGNGSAALDMRLARLYIRNREWTAARDILKRIVAAQSGRAITPDQELAIASMFARLGERSSVLSILDASGDRPTALDERLGRAELFAVSGELGRARSLVSSVLLEKESPQALLLAAALADFQGDRGQADALLARFAAGTADAATRERALAEHFSRVEDAARSQIHWRKVVEQPSATARDWEEVIAGYVLEGDVAGVEHALGRARSHLGGDGQFLAIELRVLQVAVTTPELRVLGTEYVRDRDRRRVAAEAIELLAAVESGRPSKTDLARVSALASRHPTFLALQLALAELQTRAGEIDSAIERCRASSAAFPMESAPSRALAYCFRARGEVDRARAAALDWRARSSGLPVEADLFLAQLSTPLDAIEILGPYVPRAMERGEIDVMVEYGSALVSVGRSDEAGNILAPQLASQRGVRFAWVHIATLVASRSPSLARSWLTRREVVEAATDDVQLRIELAVGWRALSVASADPSDVARAGDMARAVPRSGAFAPKEWERVGLVLEGAGDLAAAEAAYRRAVGIEPRPLVALNNLAVILARSGRAEEAVGLARTLVTRRPDIAEYRDTLALVYIESGDFRQALEQVEVARRLEPQRIRWWIGSAEMNARLGDRARARELLAEIRQHPRYGELDAEERGRIDRVTDSVR